jgi:hypothetical protein
MEVKIEMDYIEAKLDEIKTEAIEKDSLMMSTQLQLSDAKVCMVPAVQSFHS